MKKEKWFKYILLLGLTVFMTACSSVQPPNNTVPSNSPTPIPTATATPTPTPAVENVSDYIPLAVGNSWQYEGQGNEYAAYVQEVIYNKGNKYQLRYDNGGTIMANVIEVRQDSIANVYSEGENYSNTNVLNKPSNIEVILLKQPLQKGTTWTSEENIYEIVDVHASTTVPAGTFNDCIVVKCTYKDNAQMLLYYQKKVGLVLSEFKTDSGEPITSKLKEYHLVK